MTFTRPAGALAAATLAAAFAAETPPSNLVDLSIEQLMAIEIPTVVAASRHEEKVNLAPASVTVVTAEDIRRYGYRTLADVLRATAGFYTSYDYSYDYVGLRGFLRPGDLNTRFLLLVDGHRVNDNIYGQAAFGTEGVIDLDEVERVEIVRGPASALYGSSAFFGTISVVTRNGASVEGVEARVGARSAETIEAGLAYGHRFDSGADLLVSVSGAHSDGERLYFSAYDAPETNGGYTEGTDDERFHHVLVKLTFPGFAIEGVSSRRDKGIPTGAWEMPFDDSRARTTDSWSHLALTWQRRLSKTWELEARAGVDDYRYTGVYPYPSDDANQDENHGNSWGIDVRVLGTLGRVHTLTLGAEYRDDWRLHQKNFDQNPYVLTYDKHGSDAVGALYVQDQLTLDPRVRVDLGVRSDRYRSFGTTTNPRAALIYMPHPRLSLKALYGKAFRAPTAYEAFFALDRMTGDFAPNNSLHPETVATSELAGEWYAGPHLRITGSVYRYEVRDLIRLYYDDQGFEISDNVDRVTSTGGELGLYYDRTGGPQFALTWAASDAHDDTTGQHLSNSPRHLVRARGAAPLFDGRLTPALELQYESGRQTLAGAWTASRVLANLTLTARLGARVDAAAGATNLFDERYEDPAADGQMQDTLPQRGRQYWVKVRARF